jgi:L-aminopeptidase/D-esterase-like protein
MTSRPAVNCLAIIVLLAGASAEAKPRARDLGVPFEGTPGPLDAITDVAGVEVGHTTLIAGDSVRTGVTAILPRGRRSKEQAFAGWFSLNGNGEMTGTAWVDESGFLEGPVMITNTHSVGVVRDSVVAWRVQHDLQNQGFSLPVVAETWDGYLNDANGFHVRREHVFQALEGARPGPVAEGSVGGGTGMKCFEFKCGIGTASRRLDAASGGYTVGVLVQANFGFRRQLRIGGAPVGQEITEGTLAALEGPSFDAGAGSIIIVVATDAPLLPHQLRRLARRAALGVAMTGGTAHNSSGDIFLAFSTANRGGDHAESPPPLAMVPNQRISPLFDATVQATEEAIVNALVAGEPMVGMKGHRVIALPHDRLKAALKKYGRLAGP